MAKNLLLEVGSEEIPHAILLDTIRQFKDLALEKLGAAGVEFGKIFVYGTPRRLALQLTDVEEKTRHNTIEKKGPSLDKAYDADGKPTKALEGFLRGSQCELSDVSTKDFGGSEYVVVNISSGGEKITDILPGLFKELIFGLHFPKVMKWADRPDQWVRPLRWIVCILDKKIIPLEVAHIKSGHSSHGHRILNQNKAFMIDNPLEYKNLLKEQNVIVDHEERRSFIRDKVEKAALRMHARALLDDDLLDTLVSLTEYPQITVGQFEAEFLDLPKEVLISEMIDHQMFIPLEEEKSGKLINSFLITANINPNENVVKGNERVIRARFSDGQFFYNEDRKTRLEAKIPQLQQVSFAKGLGSLLDKIERMKKLASHIAGQLNMKGVLPDAHRAIDLCKADLVTGMVGEFDELQGVMGRYYATYDGEKESVALSVEQHYYPRFSGDALPSYDEGLLASLSDRIDNLFSMYATGKWVTGSKDPFALRRQTLGVIRILIEKKMHLNFSNLFDDIFGLYKGFLTIEQNDFKNAILDFITTRIKTVLKEYGFNYDEIEAGITDDISDIYDSYLRISAIHEARSSDDFANLAVAFKRIKNILKGQNGRSIVPGTFREDAEKELYALYEKNQKTFNDKLAARAYQDCVAILTSFRKAVDHFFDKVMVMDEDPAVRDNRIALLSHIDSLFNRFIDFEKIVVE